MRVKLVSTCHRSWQYAFQTSSAVWREVVTQTTFCIQTTDSQYRRIESFQARIYFQIIPLSAQPLDLFTEFHTYMQQCTRAPLRPACCEVYFITRVKEKKTSSPILPSIYSSHIIHSQMATTVPWLIIVKPESEVPKSKVQSPKVKTKRTWADTKITWATTPPPHPPHNF